MSRSPTRTVLAPTAALLLATSTARARDEDPTPFAFPEDSRGPDPLEATLPGYFNGLGTPGRYWEIQSNTSFDTSRVFTQRVEIARALGLEGFGTTDLLTVVVRANMAVDAAESPDASGIEGPIASLGLRYRSRTDRYWVEFGVRLIPGLPGPHDADPSALQLSLAATLSSGVADDARWLSFVNTGAQIYGAFQSRTGAWVTPMFTLLLGALYGGQASLAPLEVRSWLGPQTSFIGNGYLEVFVGAPVIAGQFANLQLGIHTEVSLSSIWAGGDTFPFVGNVFLGWSPKTWLSVRAFSGFASVPTGAVPLDNAYGARLEFFLP